MLAVTPFTKLPPKEYSRKLKADARAAKLRTASAAASWNLPHSSALPTIKSFHTEGSASSWAFNAQFSGRDVLQELEHQDSGEEYSDNEDDGDGNAALSAVPEEGSSESDAPISKARRYYNIYEGWKAKKAQERRHKSIAWFEEQHEKEMARRAKQREDEERAKQRQEARKLKKQADLLARFREYEAEMAARERMNQGLQQQADRKIKKIDNLIALFQEWNIENHERNIQAAITAEEEAKAAEEAKLREEAIERRAVLEQETKAEKEAEALLNKEVIRIMWQAGACYPPNKPARKVEEQIETANEVTVSLRANLQGADKAHALDLDLRKFRNATLLRGKALQTLGAVALAHQFFQGACPRLQILDLTSCGIHLAGYNRLFLALRANTVPHVHTLLLSQNGLPAAAVGLLEACVDAGGLGNLRHLDVRRNHLSDKGAQGFAHILLAGKLEKLEVLLLQGNQIKFAGINAIYRVSNTVAQTSPKLVEVNLLQNQADPSKLKTLEIVEPFLKF